MQEAYLDDDFSDEEEIVDDQGLGDEAETQFRYTITSYGADFPVDGLVRRIGDGSIYIPEFQRGFVWTLARASRFIESLLLGLPVPGIFLSKERESGKLLVIDGQQRLRTLQYFYEGIFRPTRSEFALEGVESDFEGATYASLAEDDRRRLDDSILHATIVQQDEPSEDDSSIYLIFERLNSGGMRLSAQEIRTAIYHGDFSTLLGDLNEHPAWRQVFGRRSKRMRDQEMLLRFLALHFSERYEQYMQDFLNKFMAANRWLQRYSAEEISEAFVPTVELIAEAVGSRAFRPKRAFNAAVFDAVMVGLARRLERGPVEDREGLARAHQGLLADPDFVNATETGTAQEPNVVKRLKLASSAFAGLA
jgi:hypothetical protein